MPHDTEDFITRDIHAPSMPATGCIQSILLLDVCLGWLGNELVIWSCAIAATEESWSRAMTTRSQSGMKSARRCTSCSSCIDAPQLYLVQGAGGLALMKHKMKIRDPSGETWL